jgi:glutamate-1-semialdehyde 2,1-aminomutase/spore coat polysaccharide biosynthesis protein SpsF
LIDPAICGRVLELMEGDTDYVCNNMPPGFPHGLDCEAFTAASLAIADAEAKTPTDREHVTPWLRRAPAIRRRALPGPGAAIARNRWTLDYPEDYLMLTRLFEHLPRPTTLVQLDEVLAVLDGKPELAAINFSRRDVARDAEIDGDTG